MRALPAGRHFFRGSDGYEAARRGTVWHRRVPDRYPEVIVQAVSADDIVSAIRYATVNGHKVSVVSGGHSFAASHLRDGAVLLDVSRIDHASIDADKGRAVVGPGKGGSVLMAELEAQGLFFPGGHCRGVCLGGYLLQGGYGWNSRIYGPACESVIGLDVITADGAQIHCDADNHADLYWAARGAGPGFFGVVTSFYLKLYPSRPPVAPASMSTHSTLPTRSLPGPARSAPKSTLGSSCKPLPPAVNRAWASTSPSSPLPRPLSLTRPKRPNRPSPCSAPARLSSRHWSKSLICQPICLPGMTSR